MHLGLLAVVCIGVFLLEDYHPFLRATHLALFTSSYSICFLVSLVEIGSLTLAFPLCLFTATYLLK